MHQRLASGRVNKGRSRSPLLWVPPLTAAVTLGVALGGCPGPDPREAGGGGGGQSSRNASASTGAQGGTSADGGATGTATSSSTGQADAGCGPDKTLCSNGCTDTTKDVENCGRCGNACPTSGNVLDAKCKSSVCELTCKPGFANSDPANPGCNTPARRVFVTSASTDAKFGSMLGGAHAADTFCRQAAAAAGFGSMMTWAAWIGTTQSSPLMTVIGSFNGVYVLVDGIHVVGTGTQLVNGLLLHPIDMTENMDPLVQGTDTFDVWTGTDGSGVAAMTDCAGWTTTSVDAHGVIGTWTSKTSFWTDSGQSACNAMQRLYCFEQ